jgi:hypothetical protein
MFLAVKIHVVKFMFSLAHPAVNLDCTFIIRDSLINQLHRNNVSVPVSQKTVGYNYGDQPINDM